MDPKISITAEPLDINSIYSLLGDAGSGAVVLFVGRVRDVNEGKIVSGIRYDAYKEMAERECRKIWDEACARWPINRGAIVHRVGDLAIGEISIVVAIATGHRAQVFEAARFVIDAIKERAPVWKEERYASGEKAWITNKP